MSFGFLMVFCIFQFHLASNVTAREWLHCPGEPAADKRSWWIRREKRMYRRRYCLSGINFRTNGGHLIFVRNGKIGDVLHAGDLCLQWRPTVTKSSLDRSLTWSCDY